MKLFHLFVLFMSFCLNVLSQSVMAPNYGLKSPQTAEIVRVDFLEDATVVAMTIMSDINNAYFCIDRNTFIIKPDGMKVKLRELKGLPYCPATYRFRKPGEKASFTLTFPATGFLPWFSVVEECGGGCLCMYGILTDSGLNGLLNDAYTLSDRGENMPAYRIFEDIINRTDSLNLGLEGAIFTSLILLDRKMGRPETARSWYDRLMTSHAPDLKLYLDNLRKLGINY